MISVERTILKNINKKRISEEILVSYPDFQGIHFQSNNNTGDVYKFFFTNNIDDSQLDLIIAQHDSTTTSKEAVIEIYKKREIDGKEFFNSVRADLVLSYLSGSISQSDAAFVEAKLDSTKSRVLSGDWLTAQYEITNNVVVEGVFTQETYDMIKGYIDTYILENYT